MEDPFALRRCALDTIADLGGCRDEVMVIPVTGRSSAAAAGAQRSPRSGVAAGGMPDEYRTIQRPDLAARWGAHYMAAAIEAVTDGIDRRSIYVCPHQPSRVVLESVQGAARPGARAGRQHQPRLWQSEQRLEPDCLLRSLRRRSGALSVDGSGAGRNRPHLRRGAVRAPLPRRRGWVMSRFDASSTVRNTASAVSPSVLRPRTTAGGDCECRRFGPSGLLFGASAL